MYEQYPESCRLIRFITGQSQFLTSPVPAQPFTFNLSLDDHGYDDEIATQRLEDNDSRLMEMLASQAAHREDELAIGDEDSIPTDEGIPEARKKDLLQKLLHMAASNGDVERVRKLLHGAAKTYVDINATDEEGTAPIIYASCFVRLGMIPPEVKSSFLMRSAGTSGCRFDTTRSWRRSRSTRQE